ncbi:hypothetical protein GGR56DRAFT_624172 [Xylariaceae sp. FL0804]|nr:hypothetical protein GGR56DRAFT_624172 [Xylariaceae sp. FL0804]
MTGHSSWTARTIVLLGLAILASLPLPAFAAPLLLQTRAAQLLPPPTTPTPISDHPSSPVFTELPVPAAAANTTAEQQWRRSLLSERSEEARPALAIPPAVSYVGKTHTRRRTIPPSLFLGIRPLVCLLFY